jgi:hypothetical protein
MRVILGIVLLLTLKIVAAQSIYYVATDGVDSAGRGAASAPWLSISYALTQVPDNSVVIVRPGTYNGQVRLRRNFTVGVTVRSELPYQARLRHNTTVVTTYDDVNGVEGITIEGFDIAHSAGGSPDTVIQIQDSADKDTRRITLRNNVIHDSLSNDLIKANNGASDLYIEGNIFYNQQGTDQHIDLNSVEYAYVRDNIFFNDFAASGRTNNNDTASFIVVKDSNADADQYVGAAHIEISRNVFLNWQGASGDYFILLGADGNPYFEVRDVTIENNLMIGNSSNTMRSSFGCKGCSNVVFRANTIAGNLPSAEFAFRLNREGSNPSNTDLRFENNIWSDPNGTMGDFCDAVSADNQLETIVLRNNTYWSNGGSVLNLPEDTSDLLGVIDDASGRLGDPQLPAQSTILRQL